MGIQLGLNKIIWMRLLLTLVAASTAYAGQAEGSFTLDNPYAVYAPGEAPSVSVSVPCSTVGECGITVCVIDFHGTEVSSSSKSLDCDGKALQADVKLAPLSRIGYFQARCSVSDPAGRIFDAGVVPFAVIPVIDVSGYGGSNPFGAMVFPHLSYPPQEKEKDAFLMSRIGMAWVRTHRFNWLRAQQSPDAAYDWREPDFEAALYAKHGLNIIATIGWPVPVWASEAQGKQGLDAGCFMPKAEFLPLCAKFHTALAERYKGKIACYEIGNEVDAFFWRGKLDSFLTHDSKGIIKDFVDYYCLISDALHAADPQARTAPNMTGDVPDGHSYKPWLRTALELGLGPKMSDFSTHYTGDVAAAEKLFTEFGQPEKPVLVTEIGGIVRGASNVDPCGDDMKSLIFNDYHQNIEQLATRKVSAMCKFLFREQTTYGGEGGMVAGLLENNFTIRPSYVAYATLIRTLLGASFIEELNLVRDASVGWLEGYRFKKKEEDLAVLFLHGSTPAMITLQTKASSLRLVDVMGGEREIAVSDGKAVFQMDGRLPLFVLGPVEGAAGPIEKPRDTLVRTIDLAPLNAGFEADGAAPDKMPGWSRMIDEVAAKKIDAPFTVTLDAAVAFEGKRSVRFSAATQTDWWGVCQVFPLSKIPAIEPGQYLVFKVSMRVKGENVKGMGLGYTIAFRKKDMVRIHFAGSDYFGYGGTFEWRELACSSKIEQIRPETELVSLDILLGKSTGTVWIDDVHFSVEVWRKASLDK